MSRWVLVCRLCQFEKVPIFIVGQALSFLTLEGTNFFFMYIYRSAVYVHTNMHTVTGCFHNPPNYDTHYSSVPYGPLVQRVIMTLCLNFLGVSLQF